MLRLRVHLRRRLCWLLGHEPGGSATQVPRHRRFPGWEPYCYRCRHCDRPIRLKHGMGWAPDEDA